MNAKTQMTAVLSSRSERDALPHMLSCEMASINRSYVAAKPKPKIFALIQNAQDAVGRGQRLIADKPRDPNAAMLELNEAYGLLETLYNNASMEVLETEIL